MTAIQAMKKELNRIQEKQCECVSKFGYVLPSKRYEYSTLTKEAWDLKEGIEFLEKLYNEMNLSIK